MQEKPRRRRPEMISIWAVPEPVVELFQWGFITLFALGVTLVVLFNTIIKDKDSVIQSALSTVESTAGIVLVAAGGCMAIATLGWSVYAYVISYSSPEGPSG